MRHCPAVVALSLAFAFCSSANAAVVLGNLGSDGSGGLDIGGSAFTSGVDFAVGFTTGSDDEFLELTSVILGLSQVSTDNVTVTLYDDNSGDPGSPLAWSDTQSVGAAATKVSFSASAFTLSGSTPYWLVVEAVDNYQWYGAADLSVPVVQNSSGWALASGTGTRRNTGTGWTSFNAVNAVSIEAVPEPSTIALSGLGIFAAAFFASRKRLAA